ncbi:F0F1 ATP synthase subunit epsilon [Flexistipes sp.]|uniref:F0F1 ATP synthase subunit epsilon n=1 Tax=Flexistipes sp. TaxID=3088135 RepID=UPI002E1F8178|nr:F0F1 ATP synthase subunit epsilon [Flexistipes sp.]
MAEKLKLELVSPERKLLDLEVDEVIAPGVEGDFGILPDHTPFLTALNIGELIYKHDKTTEYAAIDRGFLEVNNNRVIILAEGAELGREIDLEEAIRRKVEKEQELEAARQEESHKFSKAEIELMRELNRVSVAERYK